MNTVLTPHTAMVDGRVTGLAGCAPAHQAQCQSAAQCLRADPKLALHWQAATPAKVMAIHRCSMFIPVLLQRDVDAMDSTMGGL